VQKVLPEVGTSESMLMLTRALALRKMTEASR
jgi:hypothetical protein